MSTERPVIAAIGCSGPVAEHFVHGFVAQGVEIRLLARDPSTVAARYPGVETIAGSMAEPADVARAVEGVDAAFVLTPMGMRNDQTSEVEIAVAVVEGATRGGLPHLIYTSVFATEYPTGVGILDAKTEIERLLGASGIPHSILRCGTYMEDIFDSRKSLLDKGRFFFPVDKNRRFNYTSQRDVPRFAAGLLRTGTVLDEPVNFTEPTTYTIHDVEAALSAASGRKIRAVPKTPIFQVLSALEPLINRTGGRLSSILPLVRYFDEHGYTPERHDLADRFPDFAMTTLEQHLDRLWEARR